jgi:hypothetical protein
MATYYIDPSAQSNGNGLSDTTPFDGWNHVTFTAGNTYLQKCGTEYSAAAPTDGCVYVISANGDANTITTISSYGTGAKPILNGIQDIVGALTEGSWTEEGSHIWHMDTTVNPKRVWLDSVEIGLNVNATVTSTYPWFWGSNALYLYSEAGNPALNYTTIRGAWWYNLKILGSSYINVTDMHFKGGFVGVGIQESQHVNVYGNDFDYNHKGIGVGSGTTYTDHENSYINIYDNTIDSSYTMINPNTTHMDNISFYNSGYQCKVYGNTLINPGHASVDVGGTASNATDWPNALSYIEIYDNVMSGEDVDYGRAFSISGVHVTGQSTVPTVHHIKFFNNICHDFPTRNQVAGQYIEVYNSYFYNWRRRSTRTGQTDSVQCISVDPYTDNATCTNCLVANNTFYSLDSTAIELRDADATGLSLLTVANNLILDAGLDPYHVDDTDIGINVTDRATITDITWQNNLLYNSNASTETVKYRGTTPITIAAFNAGATNDDVISDNIASDPLLTGYVLDSASPCINAGTTIATVTTDIRGASRPKDAEYDIGAYEYFNCLFSIKDNIITISGTLTTGVSLPVGVVMRFKTSGNLDVAGTVDDTKSFFRLTSAGIECAGVVSENT